LKATTNDIADALKDSDKVEVSPDNKKIRRVNNAALPEKSPSTSNGASKKRDAKAQDKEESKKEDDSKT
jgi:hypothetical protein